jgi:hypothetical protein
VNRSGVVKARSEPSFLQKEQLQEITRAASTVTLKRTLPQWQPPL